MARVLPIETARRGVCMGAEETVRDMTQNVPILVYHHVYPDGEPGLASPSGKKATGMIGVSEFRRHLSYVAENGWEVVSTTRIVDWLEGSASLPRRAVALHFDNGWLDAFTVALPVLQEFGMTATSFVITDGTTAASEGRTARVRTSTEGEIQKPFVTWEHAARLLEAGWEIAAHTATHPRLGELHSTSGADAVLEEIEDSNEVFAQRLGFVPEHFAYPSGSRQRTDRRPPGTPLPVTAAVELQPSPGVAVHRPRNVSTGDGMPEHRQHSIVRGLHPHILRRLRRGKSSPRRSPRLGYCFLYPLRSPRALRGDCFSTIVTMDSMLAGQPRRCLA